MTIEAEAEAAQSPAQPESQDNVWLTQPVLAAILIGGVAGYFVSLYANTAIVMRQAQERADRGYERGMIAVRVLAAQNNAPSFEVRDINCDILKLGVHSSEIGQRPDTLETSGIRTTDMEDGAVCPAKVQRR